MNQRQWIQMDDTSGTNAQKISRITWSLIGATSLVALIIGLAIGVPVEVFLIGAVGSFFYVRSIKSSATSHIRAGLNTRSASEADQARIFNVVDGLCVVSGDHRPNIEVVDSQFPVAIAFGNPSQSSIVVSNGFCDLMDRVETEAVMAHLLWRIRSGEAEFTAYLVNLNAKLSRIALGAIARFIIQRSANSQAILWADIAACQATRYPPALASALEKVEATTEAAPQHISYPLWFATPHGTASATRDGVQFPNLGVSYPSLAERIGVLKEI